MYLNAVVLLTFRVLNSTQQQLIFKSRYIRSVNASKFCRQFAEVVLDCDKKGKQEYS